MLVIQSVFVTSYHKACRHLATPGNWRYVLILTLASAAMFGFRLLLSVQATRDSYMYMPSPTALLSIAFNRQFSMQSLILHDLVYSRSVYRISHYGCRNQVFGLQPRSVPRNYIEPDLG